MHKSVFVLGRQPALGLAELESLFGSDKLMPLGSQAALLDTDPGQVDFVWLGGSVKMGKLLYTFEESDWQDIHNYLIKTIPDHLQYLASKKLTLGLSTYGLHVSTKQLLATGLEVKKAVKNSGYSMRLVPNKTAELSSAQVLHNKLFTTDNWELLFIRDGGQIHMAQTVAVQDIEAYTARDQARPKRDARVGMLPPKLAQIIINLAISNRNFEDEIHLMDPFCGTGVVLQEALLMGCFAMGGDKEPRMVEFTKENIHWLYANQGYKGTLLNLDVADATNHRWINPFDTIATETYLGRPFAHEPKPEVLKEVMQDVDTIHRKFLENIASQTESGFRMCIAIPAWFVGGKIHHLKTLDSLEKLGYTRVVFKNATNQDLIYHREGQIVGRELVVLQRT